MKNKRKELLGVDLFAGAGGFSLAAAKAGIKIKAAVEMNEHASETYRANLIKRRRNPAVLFECDIASLSSRKLMSSAGLKKHDCDVLIGGPPCQGFSTHRLNDKGVDDPRNDLLLRYFSFVSDLNPRTFVVENVPGLLWKRHQKYLRKFLKKAKEANYSILGPTLLNARDFGVPQSRKRVFIIGVRNDANLKIEWPPKQTHFSPTSREVLEQGKPVWRTAQEVFDRPLSNKDINAVHMQHSERIVELFRNTPENGGSRADSGRTLPCHDGHDGHKDVYGRIDPSKPSPTMTTACINPSKGRFVHPTEPHGITARHAARFQSFPDSFQFGGGLIASGVQIGNAVPVDLGKAVLTPIQRALSGKKKGLKRKALIRRVFRKGRNKSLSK